MSSLNAITPTRRQNFAQWYQEVIKVADLAKHSVVRGCMIIKPTGYALWEALRQVLDTMIKDTGHQNVYFPLLIPLSFLEKEAAHVEGFAKECAIVTHYRLEVDTNGKLIPSPQAELTEPLVIRPTSETIIGHEMALWIRSYHDLPVLINQWANVMRWEMRPRLFLRTSEFLWQEGHTAHESDDEAMAETLTMLEIYRQLVEDYLAIPVIRGEKTPAERFPGAINTYTIEAMMQDGKALQVGTSHHLGQNFSRAYDIKFTDKNQQLSHVWTTSWGISTRLIGALIMTHSDDDGLVLPPRIAPEQIILIPVAMKAEDMPSVISYCEQLVNDLHQSQYHSKPLRIKIDTSDRRAGDKFWNAVKKGIPIRIEVGQREIAAGNLMVSRRDKPPKDKELMTTQNLLENITALLEEIQQQLFNRARRFRDDNIHDIATLHELDRMFSNNEENSNNGFALVYFDVAMENDVEVVKILKNLKLTTRCIPFQEPLEAGNCIFSGNKTNQKVILARAY